MTGRRNGLESSRGGESLKYEFEERRAGVRGIGRKCTERDENIVEEVRREELVGRVSSVGIRLTKLEKWNEMKGSTENKNKGGF